MSSPSCTFVNSLTGTGGILLLIRIGGVVELETDFSGGLEVSDGALAVLGPEFLNVV